MGLQRTALTRRTELRRTELRRGKPMARGRAPKPSKTRRPANTGPTAATRARVLDRADGCCESCGLQVHADDRWTGTHSFHHRRPRGAGGTRRPDTNSPANLLLLCGTGTTGCHGLIEQHRALAYDEGWLVHQHQDPAAVPVSVWIVGRTLLTHHGAYEPQEAA